MLRIRLGQGRLIRGLAATVVVLALLGVVARLVIDGWPGSPPAHLLRLFNASVEGTVSAWFASLLLLACAVLLAVVAAAAFARSDPQRWRWASLSAVFLALSVDETAAIHEMAIVPLREGLGVGGPLYYAWVIPGALLAIGLGALYWPLVRALPGTLRRRVVAAGAIFLGGALGLEMVTAALVDARSERQLLAPMISVAEELAEMTGVLLFLSVLMRLVRDRAGPLEVQLADGAAFHAEVTTAHSVDAALAAMASGEPHPQSGRPAADRELHEERNSGSILGDAVPPHRAHSGPTRPDA